MKNKLFVILSIVFARAHAAFGLRTGCHHHS